MQIPRWLTRVLPLAAIAGVILIARGPSWLGWMLIGAAATLPLDRLFQTYQDAPVERQRTLLKMALAFVALTIVLYVGVIILTATFGGLSMVPWVLVLALPAWAGWRILGALDRLPRTGDRA